MVTSGCWCLKAEGSAEQAATAELPQVTSQGGTLLSLWCFCLGVLFELPEHCWGMKYVQVMAGSDVG